MPQREQLHELYECEHEWQRQQQQQRQQRQRLRARILSRYSNYINSKQGEAFIREEKEGITFHVVTNKYIICIKIIRSKNVTANYYVLC